MLLEDWNELPRFAPSRQTSKKFLKRFSKPKSKIEIERRVFNMDSRDSGKKFAVPEVPKKYTFKSEPMDWSDLREKPRDDEKRQRRDDDDIRPKQYRQRRSSSTSSSSSSSSVEIIEANVKTEEDYLKLIKKKSKISIDRTERKGEWLTKVI